eukprot:Opistho-2@14582
MSSRRSRSSSIASMFSGSLSSSVSSSNGLAPSPTPLSKPGGLEDINEDDIAALDERIEMEEATLESLTSTIERFYDSPDTLLDECFNQNQKVKRLKQYRDQVVKRRTTDLTGASNADGATDGVDPRIATLRMELQSAKSALMEVIMKLEQYYDTPPALDREYKAKRKEMDEIEARIKHLRESMSRDAHAAAKAVAAAAEAAQSESSRELSVSADSSDKDKKGKKRGIFSALRWRSSRQASLEAHDFPMTRAASMPDVSHDVKMPTVPRMSEPQLASPRRSRHMNIAETGSLNAQQQDGMRQRVRTVSAETPVSQARTASRLSGLEESGGQTDARPTSPMSPRRLSAENPTSPLPSKKKNSPFATVKGRISGLRKNNPMSSSLEMLSESKSSSTEGVSIGQGVGSSDVFSSVSRASIASTASSSLSFADLPHDERLAKAELRATIVGPAMRRVLLRDHTFTLALLDASPEDDVVRSVIDIVMEESDSTMAGTPMIVQQAIKAAVKSAKGASQLFAKHDANSRVIKEYLERIGFVYRAEVLSSIVDRVSCTGGSYELATDRLGPKEAVEENMRLLAGSCAFAVDAIVASAGVAPPLLRDLCRRIKEECDAAFGAETPKVGLTATAEWLMHRFMVPGLCVPENFGASKRTIASATMRRNLMLIAKVLMAAAATEPHGSRPNARDVTLTMLSKQIELWQSHVSMYTSDLASTVSMALATPVQSVLERYQSTGRIDAATRATCGSQMAVILAGVSSEIEQIAHIIGKDNGLSAKAKASAMESLSYVTRLLDLFEEPNLRSESLEGPGRTWRDVIGGQMYDMTAPTIRRRQEAIVELANTERQYLSDLKLTRDLHYECLRHMLPRDRLDLIFHNFMELIPLHTQLVKDFTARQALNGGLVDCVGDLFLANLPKLEVYILFVAGQSHARVEIQRLKENREFNEFLEGSLDLPKTRKLPLWNFLMQPKQRLMKYKLLLQEIHKNTPADHPDRVQLGEAIGKMDSLLLIINRRLSESEAILKAKGMAQSSGFLIKPTEEEEAEAAAATENLKAELIKMIATDKQRLADLAEKIEQCYNVPETVERRFDALEGGIRELERRLSILNAGGSLPGLHTHKRQGSASSLSGSGSGSAHLRRSTAPQTISETD